MHDQLMRAAFRPLGFANSRVTRYCFQKNDPGQTLRVEALLHASVMDRWSSSFSCSANDRYRPGGGFDEGASVDDGMSPTSRNHRTPTAGDNSAPTAAGPHAAPPVVGQESISSPAHTDPNAASMHPLQPPPSECCNDQLSLPSLVEALEAKPGCHLHLLHPEVRLI